MKLFPILLILFLLSCEQHQANSILNFNELSSHEKYMILNKGTEQPYSGKFNKHYEKGVYICRQCNTELFRSESKFDSGTGWPSFDESIDKNVATQSDFTREEIVCASCNGHLGHVFKGEGMTKKNTRHCVNSAALDFIPEENIKEAIFASGCFWGTDYWLRQVKGVISTRSGYIGGTVKNPSYEDVCTGTTGHYEAVLVRYDDRVTDFRTLAEMYFNTHNPEQIDGQGNDRGPQYLPAIFYKDSEQKKLSENLLGELKSKGLKPATDLILASTFWDAEEYHQDYYLKNGKKPYCHFYRPLID